MQRLTQASLERLCREWQRRLRLQDWDVGIDLVRDFDMEMESAEGLCRHIPVHKRAHIQIRNPIDHDHSLGFPVDVEATIVHELIHIIFSPFAAADENSRAAMDQETAVEQLAQAFIKMKREAEAMPMRKGKSQAVISQNIAEYHQGPNYQKIKERRGKAVADRVAVAAAETAARGGKKRTKAKGKAK